MVADEMVMVGVPGFEPGTSWTQTRRATRLPHTPRIDWLGQSMDDAAPGSIGTLLRGFSVATGVE